MSYLASWAQALDYQTCRYGKSKLVFRGPKKITNHPYIAVLGGTEVYGRFVARPFPDLLEIDCNIQVLNLGCQNAGVDAFLRDADVLDVAKGAQLTLLQVMSAQHLSNRFYRVHPRRNDRFLGPTDALINLYGEVDFTAFNFTKHMLTALNDLCANRFAELRQELERAWIERMRVLLRTLKGPVLLVWLRRTEQGELGQEPLFVTADMVAHLSQHLSGVTEVPVVRAGNDLFDMIYGSLEAPVASEMLSVAAHRDIAAQLAPIVVQHLQHAKEDPRQSCSQGPFQNAQRC